MKYQVAKNKSVLHKGISLPPGTLVEADKPIEVGNDTVSALTSDQIENLVKAGSLLSPTDAKTEAEENLTEKAPTVSPMLAEVSDPQDLQPVNPVDEAEGKPQPRTGAEAADVRETHKVGHRTTSERSVHKTKPAH